jgi:transcriptional regulator
MAAPLDFLRGTLDLLVLKTLSWGPEHGYGIARWIERCTDDALEIEEGSLYPALYRLEHQRWIAAEWGVTDNNRRARYYHLTPAGRKQLRATQLHWTRFASAVAQVMNTAPAR